MKRLTKLASVVMVGLIFLLVAGCSGGETETRVINRLENICDDATVDKRAEFILTCIANANPKSDEEPEDWIKKCQQMAEDTYCPKKQVVAIQEYSGGWWHDRAVTPKGK